MAEPSRAPPPHHKAKHKRRVTAYGGARAGIVSLYAAKITAARLSLPRAQLAAAEAAIRIEERAALDALKREHLAKAQAFRTAARQVTWRNQAQPNRPRERTRNARRLRLRRNSNLLHK